jgi:hypothetical protein
MDEEERANIKPMSPELMKQYSNCAHMKYICQAGDLVHTAELFLEHEHNPPKVKLKKGDS